MQKFKFCPTRHNQEAREARRSENLAELQAVFIQSPKETTMETN